MSRASSPSDELTNLQRQYNWTFKLSSLKSTSAAALIHLTLERNKCRRIVSTHSGASGGSVIVHTGCVLTERALLTSTSNELICNPRTPCTTFLQPTFLSSKASVNNDRVYRDVQHNMVTTVSIKINPFMLNLSGRCFGSHGC